MKILITGGHFTPALSLISTLKKQIPPDKLDILFIGRKYALDSEKTDSLEYQELNEKGIHFIPLETGRLTRVISVKTLLSLLKIPLGFVHAMRIIQREKPDLVFSFGGYLALPIVFWAAVFNISVYTHEQTIHPGLANRMIGFFAKKIFVAFAESSHFFNPQKLMIVGNPVRETIFQVIKKPFDIEKKKPVLYVTGGSLGSHSINVHIHQLLPQLLKKYIVIHQLGDTKEYQDYERSVMLKKDLPTDLKNNYYPKKHFYEDEIGYIYSLSDLVIGRAGANTFFELLALQKPALFIPLPWAANNEQQKHAELFKNCGTGEIFHQSGSSKELYKIIDHMINNLDEYKKHFKSLQHLYKKNAQELIVKEIMASV